MSWRVLCSLVNDFFLVMNFMAILQHKTRRKGTDFYDALFWCLRVLHIHGAYTNMQANRHQIKINVFKKNNALLKLLP